MLSDHYEQIESIALDVAIVGLFLLMAYVVFDVLKKNNVPLIGKVVVYNAIGYRGLISVMILVLIVTRLNFYLS